MRPLCAFALLLALALPRAGDAAETLRISVIKAATYGALFIANERGYFAAEGIAPQFVYFEASPPIAVAVVSGDLDIGIGATSAAFFQLVDKLRIVGGFAREEPGFQGMTFVASNRGWDNGVRALKDLGGHSVSIGTVGSSPHYSLALIEQKYGIDPKSVDVVPLQSTSNQASALIGGRVEAGVTIATVLMPAVAAHQTHLLGFVGDETPWQLSSIFVPVRMADEKRDIVERFLHAYRKGAHDYMAAFADAAGKRRDGPTAPAILAIIGKYVGQTPAQVATAIAYVDPDARVEMADLQRQVDWYRSQGMLKGDVAAAPLVDRRYAGILP